MEEIFLHDYSMILKQSAFVFYCSLQCQKIKGTARLDQHLEIICKVLYLSGY